MFYSLKKEKSTTCIIFILLITIERLLHQIKESLIKYDESPQNQNIDDRTSKN